MKNRDEDIVDFFKQQYLILGIEQTERLNKQTVNKG